jgi:hypothetical protein
VLELGGAGCRVLEGSGHGPIQFPGRADRSVEEHRIRYCLIGGQAVNASAEPLVSLDLDSLVAVDQLPSVEELFEVRFQVERFAHSLNVSAPGSNLRVLGFSPGSGVSTFRPVGLGKMVLQTLPCECGTLAGRKGCCSHT